MAKWIDESFDEGTTAVVCSLHVSAIEGTVIIVIKNDWENLRDDTINRYTAQSKMANQTENGRGSPHQFYRHMSDCSLYCNSKDRHLDYYNCIGIYYFVYNCIGISIWYILQIHSGILGIMCGQARRLSGSVF